MNSQYLTVGQSRKRLPPFPIIVASALLCAISGFSAGTTAFPILMEPADPRALALGGAPLADRGWSGGLTLNPASAAAAGNTCNIDYARQVAGIWSGRIAGSYAPLPRLTAGGFITTFDYGSLDRTAYGTGKIGEFSAAEHVLGLFGAYDVSSVIGLGASAKFVWGQIADVNASGAALDAGINIDPNWQRLRIGIAILNLGKEFDGYGRDREPMPTVIALGGSRRLEHLPLTISLRADLTRKDEGDWSADFLPGNPGITLAGGAELTLPAGKDAQPVDLRLGYRSLGQGLRVGSGADMLAGFSFGVGISIRNLQFDYAFAPLGALGNVHRLGFTMRFKSGGLE